MRSVLLVVMERLTPEVDPPVQALLMVPEVSNDAVDPDGGRNSYRMTV